jgi:PhnB protein
VTPYLSFSGNCEEALNFYASVLGGKIEGLNRFAGSPMESDVPADFKNKIMHGSLTSPLGTLMGADSSQPLDKGNRVSLSITPQAADADRIFGRLADGGAVMMPLQEVFWGGRFGVVTDRYGFSWMLSVT